MIQQRAESANRPFWYWSNWKRSTRSQIQGTVIEVCAHSIDRHRVVRRLKFGVDPIQPAELPPIEARISLYNGLAEDCAGSPDGIFPVSDRLKSILEEHAPGNCEFVPIKLVGDNAANSLVYWAMYVDAIDCADQVKSGRSSGSICDPVIVPDRVPGSTHVFRIRDEATSAMSDSRPLVRDGLRRILKRKKVTGGFFYEPPLPQPPLSPHKV